MWLEYLWQKYAALIEMNIKHHTSEWFLNKPNGWVILFGDVITDLRLPVLYVYSRQMNENVLSVELNNTPILKPVPKYAHGMEIYMHSPVS